MRLSFFQIKNISNGVLGIEEKNGLILFRRFTNSQIENYNKYNPELGRKTLLNIGVSLDFVTNSSFVELDLQILWFRFNKHRVDIYVDKKYLSTFSCTKDESNAQHIHFDLDGHGHRVTIFFDSISQVGIESLSLSDGSSVLPVRKNLKIYVLGDSITQGFNADCPSNNYVNLLSKRLNAIVLNQGIGGECFRSGIIDPTIQTDCDLILIAYGTNDWNSKTLDNFKNDADCFFKTIKIAYPEKKIVYISPIYREDTTRPRQCGISFFEGCKTLINIAKENNLFVIDGLSLVPHKSKYFADGLHPNDSGFIAYEKQLFIKLKEMNIL